MIDADLTLPGPREPVRSTCGSPPVRYRLAVAASSITPAPTDEEAAAIAAALEAMWPRPSPVLQPAQSQTLAWRFSGRWWQRDRMAAPDRPWR
jgi:hypothetical protein